MSPGKLNSRRIFTPSDDALIRHQPFTGMGLKTLEAMLHTNQEVLMRRAEELGVSLVIHDDYDEAVDPLLQRLKRTHRDRKEQG
jgi:2-phosphoglycerate kinase